MYAINILTVGHLGQDPQHCTGLLIALHYIALYICRQVCKGASEDNAVTAKILLQIWTEKAAPGM